MEPKHSYLALTIGPITKSLSLAKKTRELWSVSFTFSLLMEELINAFEKYGKLISPGRDVKFPMHGAGIYPDKCYFKLHSQQISEKEIMDSKKEAFISFHNRINHEGTENYFQVYIVQAAIDTNPIGKLNEMIDVLEMQQNYSPMPAVDWKKYWHKNGAYFQNLYKIGFATDDELLPDLYLNNQYAIRRFPSIPEISTNEFARRFGDKYWQAIGYQGLINHKMEAAFTRITDQDAEFDDDDKIIQKIKKAFPDDFFQRHKYFSIVQADGDNIGKLIEAIDAMRTDEKTDNSITILSKQLNDFAKDAAKLLVHYGAFPVYIGGDDLLFFAPIANNQKWETGGFRLKAHGNIFGNNLFFLLSKLNEMFQDKLELVKTNNIPVSLSFGVMCGYYKQPLREIRMAAAEALFEDAKKQPDKNYISLIVQKHSGQAFSLGLKQEGKLYESFLKLSSSASKDIDENFLNSVMYKLDDQKAVLNRIGEKRSRLKIFFKENFNESYQKFDSFFEIVADLISEVFIEFTDKPLQTKIDKIYGALRFVHFINAKDVNE